MNWLPLKSVRIQNYKAIRDTGNLNFSPFTLLIGNNGSGKSSLIEGLEALRGIGTRPIDEVFLGPRAIEHVLNKTPKKSGRIAPNTSISRATERLRIAGSGRIFEAPNPYSLGFERLKSGLDTSFAFHTEIASVENGNGLLITRETLNSRVDWSAQRYEGGYMKITERIARGASRNQLLSDNDSLLRYGLHGYFAPWQMLGLIPENMGLPATRRANPSSTSLERDGSNIADVLSHIATSPEFADVFRSVVETMANILGYADRFDPRQDSGAIRSRYIELDEGAFTVPGWMMSTGSLRIIGLLLALRCARTPTVVMIEEIENGLDPRTLGMLMEEIGYLTRAKKVQVIATTHSPHLLDQVALEQVIFVQRRDGVPHFLRPSESEHVASFRDHFSPGRLYTMGVLAEAARRLP